MHADKASTAGAKPASIDHVPRFLSACICVHLRLNIPLHPSVLTYANYLKCHSPGNALYVGGSPALRSDRTSRPNDRPGEAIASLDHTLG